MVKDEELILTEETIRQKIRRMAFEIYENNFQEKEIILAGIYDKGYILADFIKKELEEISPIKATKIKVDLDKFAPLQSEITLDCDPKVLKNKAVILIDDVLNTGRTIAYSLKPFLNVKVKKIEVAVLVNRSHSTFPILCKYTGYELATTINEHVEVILSGPKLAVYLR